MSDDPTDKILACPGLWVAVAVVIFLVALLLIWIAACAKYPVAILSPVLITLWMAWSEIGGKDE